MEKDKIVYLKEKQIQKKADDAYNFECSNVQNPIDKKFLAFKQTKAELKQDILKDFFD